MSKSTQAQAAAMIRKELKRHGIDARVTSSQASMMTAVDVVIDDPLPATLERIKAFVSEFQYGSFDGMQDMYVMDSKRNDLPQVKYATVTAHYSDALRQAVWDYCRATFADCSSGPESADAAGQYRVGYEWGDQFIWRVLRGDIGQFWASRKPRLAA